VGDGAAAVQVAARVPPASSKGESTAAPGVGGGTMRPSLARARRTGRAPGRPAGTARA